MVFKKNPNKQTLSVRLELDKKEYEKVALIQFKLKLNSKKEAIKYLIMKK
jgi:hypothetical protein